MEFLHYIKEEAIVLIPVLWVIGMILKRSRSIYDNAIPLVLLVCGIASSMLLLGLNIRAIIQGILCAGAAVGLHATKKQLQKLD